MQDFLSREDDFYKIKLTKKENDYDLELKKIPGTNNFDGDTSVVVLSYLTHAFPVSFPPIH